MKIAVIADHLDNIGGAEIVSLVLARELNADIYTTNLDTQKIEKMGFKDVLPRIFSIGKIPINPPFRQQLTLFRFRLLNLKNKYAFYIISGDWAISAVVNNKPSLWYVHTPIRELWDSYEYTRNNLIPQVARPFFDVWVFINRILNKRYTKKANKIVCNSINTKQRLEKFLKIKDVPVINPPSETKDFYYSQNGNFWLSVNRLVVAKRIDMQLEAFKMLPKENLIIVGSYEKGSHHFEKEKNRLYKMAPNNVEFKSWVSKEELLDLYANCKGLITTATDEDFGMTPVEAMASGKPVIAPAEGGYCETVINGVTGILMSHTTPESIRNAIIKISSDLSSFKDICIKRAKDFDTEIFAKKIKKEIEKIKI